MRGISVDRASPVVLASHLRLLAHLDRIMSGSPLLNELIEALRCLPGVGGKSAQRMAFHLLERERERGLKLATVLQQAMQKIGHCTRCRNFSEATVCAICANTSRDRHVLCVVESPTDLAAIEQATGYRGQYFVLDGAPVAAGWPGAGRTWAWVC